MAPPPPARAARRGSALLLPGLLLAAALAAAALVAPPAARAAVEPETGVAFPDELAGQALVATGARRKLGLRVYAVGLYLDRRSRLWGRAPSREELLRGAAGRARLRLVITSSFITQERLAGALRESLGPRLRGLRPAQAAQVLDDFQAVLSAGPRLRRGATLVFALGRGGVQVEAGRHRGEVPSAPLAAALLSTYLDGEAVIPGFAEAVVASLSEGPRAARGR